MLLDVSQIRTDGGTQPRAAINDALALEYLLALREGATFPPVVVFYDGTDYWLADGFHRLKAHERAERQQIETEVRQGTQRDAVLYAVGANAQHGWRRTNEDKRRAVQTLLDDPEWAQWSDREIARRCAVSDRFVNELRREQTANGSQLPAKRKGADGKTRRLPARSSPRPSAAASAEEMAETPQSAETPGVVETPDVVSQPAAPVTPTGDKDSAAGRRWRKELTECVDWIMRSVEPLDDHCLDRYLGPNALNARKPYEAEGRARDAALQLQRVAAAISKQLAVADETQTEGNPAPEAPVSRYRWARVLAHLGNCAANMKRVTDLSSGKRTPKRIRWGLCHLRGYLDKAERVVMKTAVRPICEDASVPHEECE